MISLFSVFDPVTLMGVSLNWMVFFIFIIIVPLGYYNYCSVVNELGDLMSSVVSMMFKDISYPNFSGLVMVGFILFMFIMVMNIMGLFPFVFSASGHLMITLSMGLVLWMMSFVMGWFLSFKTSTAHMVPEGSPLILAPFMVVIESVSHLIRPITLSVRLAANMMAGHLIVGLISSISLVSFPVFWVSVFLQMLMMVLESAVCFIQAFVFSVLVVLYSLDFY